MQFSLTFLSLVAAALAAPTELQARAPAVCGSVSYTSAQTNAASVAACNYVRNGGTAGSSSYPHTYRNDEGFRFGGLAGPFYEFPILSNGRVYTGGSPGPDRVVINSACRQAGTITHTGASGNAFVACQGTS
ncbi:Ribonuclease/ribotoxin [Stachybotrys elegans]|uniref:ribonuclease T1 n=1 Tax=Stachybotrys elegans TaxID=80388 RepID=A0A8K0SIP4_9HYPO|nr:Ribonuclease/ribotoxin [Stachybotrys elegans]